MKEKEVKNLVEKLNRRAHDATRICLFKGCKVLSIQSHLLQKKGIINQIAERNHVIELGINNFKPDKFYFKRIGINESFTFPGFCAEHDHLIFREIENENTDYSSYRTQLLLSYRAVMNEKRKKEIAIDSYNRILNSNTLSPYLTDDYKKSLRQGIDGYNAGIRDELYYEDFFLTNIDDPTLRDFKFLTFELPKIEVCSSAVFTYETSAEIIELMKQQEYKNGKALTEIYFNLLPLENKSIIVIGCLNERVNTCWEFIESFQPTPQGISFKRLSDLLLCQVENWLCSEGFYREKLKPREKTIFQISHESSEHLDERRELGFNIFD